MVVINKTTSSKCSIQIKVLLFQGCPFLLAVNLHSFQQAEVLLHLELFVSNHQILVLCTIDIRVDLFNEVIILLDDPAKSAFQLQSV